METVPEPLPLVRIDAITGPVALRHLSSTRSFGSKPLTVMVTSVPGAPRTGSRSSDGTTRKSADASPPDVETVIRQVPCGACGMVIGVENEPLAGMVRVRIVCDRQVMVAVSPGVKPLPPIVKTSPTSPEAVSYTHLRAHETDS